MGTKTTHILCLMVCITQFCFSQILSKKELQEFNGFFDFYYSLKEDKIYLEVAKTENEFLYVYSLASGVGSNDIGLDRGQIGDGVIVKFVRAGNKLLLVQPNQRYKANTNNLLEKKSVEQAFAKSVLFGFKILEETKENYIIDITSFLKQDKHGVAKRLQQKGEGTYRIDGSRSALQLQRTKAFPKNVEFESLVTFTGTPKGDQLYTVAPDPAAVSVIMHHSFVELPDDKFEKRAFDPRSGALYISYLDYATPIQEPIEKRYILKHRLEKKQPKKTISEAIDPIIYYLDPGTPEPVKSALLEGASWWNQAFEAIGYKNAFQIKMLPVNADPMDIRYNVIQWVHRSTRGWSYGASVIDPRTGEILKGHVSLGSLRIRQDFLIAQALLKEPFKNDDTNYQPMLEMALDRIRQLSAHEIGHTLGFAHNFAASTQNRASVMDYPHPLVTLDKDEIVLRNAYDDKIGAWDKVSVAYSYGELPENVDETKELNKLLQQAYNDGLRYITDQDARPKGGAHAEAHLWDNGENASAELSRVLSIRKKAIENFSKNNIKTNEPYTVLEDVFVPLYFFHRYQTEAATKQLGGLMYNYALKGSEQTIVRTVDKKVQRKALKEVLETIAVENLAIPKDKLELFPPRAFGYQRSRESFKGKTGVGFDAISVAETASEMTLSLMLHPQRTARLVQQKALNNTQLGLVEVLDQLIANSFQEKHNDSYHKEVQYAINNTVLKYMMALAVDKATYFQVRAIVDYKIDELYEMLKARNKKNELDNIYTNYYLKRIEEFRRKPELFKIQYAPKIPDGSPIGSDICNFTE